MSFGNSLEPWFQKSTVEWRRGQRDLKIGYKMKDRKMTLKKQLSWLCLMGSARAGGW